MNGIPQKRMTYAQNSLGLDIWTDTKAISDTCYLNLNRECLVRIECPKFLGQNWTVGYTGQTDTDKISHLIFLESEDNRTAYDVYVIESQFELATLKAKYEHVNEKYGNQYLDDT